MCMHHLEWNRRGKMHLGNGALFRAQQRSIKRGNDRRETEPMQLTEEVRCALHGTLQIHCEDIQPNG